MFPFRSFKALLLRSMIHFEVFFFLCMDVFWFLYDVLKKQLSFIFWPQRKGLKTRWPYRYGLVSEPCPVSCSMVVAHTKLSWLLQLGFEIRFYVISSFCVSFFQIILAILGPFFYIYRIILSVLTKKKKLLRLMGTDFDSECEIMRN